MAPAGLGPCCPMAAPPWWLALAFMAPAWLGPCCPMAAPMVACFGFHGHCWPQALLPHGCPHGGLLWLSWPLLASSLAAQWLPPWWLLGWGPAAPWLPPWWLALAFMATAGLKPCCPWLQPWWLALAFMATAGLKPCCPMAAHMVACIGLHGPSP